MKNKILEEKNIEKNKIRKNKIQICEKVGTSQNIVFFQ